MAFDFFGSGTAAAKYFDIRLDDDVIFLRGSPAEAASAVLKGTLVLCLAESLQVKNVNLRLTGESRVAWQELHSTQSARPGKVKQQQVFFQHLWTFVESPRTLKAGNYEWPFQVVIPGDTAESVEGLHDSWVAWRMKATIERGRLSHNLTARKHVRIVRTLGPGSLETAHAMAIESIWPQKVEYSLSIPTKAFIYGTAVHVDIRLVPLLKGLKIGKITVIVFETQDLETNDRKHQNVRNVALEEWDMQTEQAEDFENGQEGFMASRDIQLPRNLRKCMQDVHCQGIKVRHKARFNVQLLNPDGHVSELRAVLPLMIFISPNLRLDESNNVTNQPTVEDLDELDGRGFAPPLYGEHQFDQLYREIDPSAYMTPAGGRSGVSTPFMARSRNASHENLASLAGVTHGAFAPEALENRLIDLHMDPAVRARNRNQHSLSGSTTPHPGEEVNGELVSGSRTPNELPYTAPHSNPASVPPSNPLSRQPSEEESGTTSEPLHIDTAELSRVPSYNTAVKTPARTPYSSGLPGYMEALSAPPSPPLATSLPGRVHFSETVATYDDYFGPAASRSHSQSPALDNDAVPRSALRSPH